MGFGDNDHAIRELMRFIEMTSRESKNEDDIQVAGVVITKGGQTELKGGLNSFMF